MRSWKVTGFCETCGRLFYTPIGKFCDVHLCQGYVYHVERAAPPNKQEDADG